MKEKDLDKKLEKIIIDGLIKEANQDNIEFATAMRKIPEEEFLELINGPVYEGYTFAIDGFASDSKSYSDKEVAHDPKFSQAPEIHAFDLSHNHVKQHKSHTRHKSKDNRSGLKQSMPWLTAAVSAVAIILIVLLPSYHAMNVKLCESALYMSNDYITSDRGGFDISTATVAEIEDELPALKQRFEDSYSISSEGTIYNPDFQDAGWNLAIACLKLHKRKDAVKVLKTLETHYRGTPFGIHCEELIKQLD